MKRIAFLGCLLLMPFLSIGCGSGESSDDPNSPEVQAEIETNDAAVDAAESAQ